MIIPETNAFKNIPEEIGIRVKEMHTHYKFKYLGSFGNNYLKGPIGLNIFDSNKTIYVSDTDGHKIQKFTLEGDYIGEVPLKLKMPQGLFRSKSNNLWICDFANTRLVAIDIAERQVNEIYLPEIIGEKSCFTKPGQCFVYKNHMYLILTHKGGYGGRQFITFDMEKPYESFKKISWSGLFMPCGMFLKGDYVYISNQHPNKLYRYNLLNKEVVQMNISQIVGLPLRLYISEESIFLNTRRYITKIFLDGKICFHANLEKMFKTKEFDPYSMAIFHNNNDNLFFITDRMKGCIHKFLV